MLAVIPNQCRTRIERADDEQRFHEVRPEHKIDHCLRPSHCNRMLKSPPHSPKANAICERVIGTIRRECLDWLIPISELHLRSVLKAWMTHYNEARPHMALGPGVPDTPPTAVQPATQLSCHQIGGRLLLRVKSILGGLHHEYSLAPQLARSNICGAQLVQRLEFAPRIPLASRSCRR